MTRLRWVPRFIYNGIDFTLTYPVTRWNPGTRTTGTTAKTATNIPGTTLVLRKYPLAMQLRFTEDEWWDSVRDFLLWAQHGNVFSWFHNDLSTVDEPVSFQALVDFPRVTDAITPTRDGTLIWLMTVPITLLKSDGSAWSTDYMTLPDILPEDATAQIPSHYTVTAADDTIPPFTSTLITAQLKAADDTPIHQAGHLLTFAVTGTGGTLSTLTGITDDLGQATTTLHGGAYLTIHTVSVRDEDLRMGFSGDIEVITAGTSYAVTSDSYERLTTETVLITTQLKNGGSNVAEAGHTITWAKTAGVGGTFSAPTSVTDVTGKATVTLTFGTSDTNYTITATDEFFTTGASPAIHSLDEGLGFLRAISNLEFLIDATVSPVLSSGVLIGLTDHSGKNRTVTLIGGGHNPTYEAAGWALTPSGTMARLTFDHDTGQWFLFDFPDTAQPITIITVMDGFAVTGAGQHNLWNLGGSVFYRHTSWSQIAGIIADTTILSTDPASQGKVIRIDILDNINSQVFRGSTTSALINPGTGGIVHGTTAFGARADGVDAATVKLATGAIFSKRLSSTELANVISDFVARYPGLAST